MEPGEPTRPSLLERVRDPADAAAWQEFTSRYRTLIVRYCRARGAQPADAEDVAQQILIGLSRALPGFQYDRTRGRFRDYLRRAVLRELGRLWRQRDRIPVPVDDEDIEAAQGVDDLWEQEWMAHHYRRAVETMRATVDERTMAVFDRLLSGMDAPQVANAFSMGVEAVRKTRQRVKAKLETIINEQVSKEDEG